MINFRIFSRLALATTRCFAPAFAIAYVLACSQFSVGSDLSKEATNAFSIGEPDGVPVVLVSALLSSSKQIYFTNVSLQQQLAGFVKDKPSGKREGSEEIGTL
jgi:hypothetical protein